MAKHCDRLRKALEMRGMRPSVLAYRTGISEAAISHYLSGDYVPKSKRMALMAEVLRVSPAWLSGFDVDAERPGIANNAIIVPVLGKVAAGIPIEAVQDILDYEELSPDMVRDGSEYFALQLKGDSMEPRMHSGDVVIVRKQETIESGEIAIVCVNGDEATCKKVIFKDNGAIILQPLNQMHEPIYFTAEEVRTLPITILGKVVELRAKF